MLCWVVWISISDSHQPLTTLLSKYLYLLFSGYHLIQIMPCISLQNGLFHIAIHISGSSKSSSMDRSFFSHYLMVLPFIFITIFYFWKKISFCVDCFIFQVVSIVQQHLLKKTILSPMNTLYSFIKYLLTTLVQGYFWEFYHIPLI